MGWDYFDTNCKYRNVCDGSMRCRGKSIKDAECWTEDNRNFWEKHFGDQMLLKREMENKFPREE